MDVDVMFHFYLDKNSVTEWTVQKKIRGYLSLLK